MKTTSKHTFSDYVQFFIFSPFVLVGWLWAKSRLYFEVGKSIGENF